MTMRNIAAKVRAGKETEVAEAIGFALQLDRAATVPEAQEWVNRQVNEAVLKYRESQNPDIDRTDPTES